jgi:hypothetical protein
MIWFIVTRFFAPLIRGVASVFSASRGVDLVKVKNKKRK